MAELTVDRTYGNALFEAASELDRIEEVEEELKALDKEWESIADEIDLKLRTFVYMLKGKDSKAVMEATIGNKAPLLYAIMENYDRDRAEKIQEMADFIAARLPKLKALQDQAKK